MSGKKLHETNVNAQVIKDASSKDVSDPMKDIVLSSQEIAGVLTSATAGTIASSIPGVNKFFEWVERADQASKEEKLKILFKQYSSHFGSIDDALSKLKLLITTRGGQTLFRKIIQIVDKGPEDQEWINLLAEVLRKISNQEFEKYFDENMYALAQIDRLSPQALIVLGKYSIWKEVNIQGTTTTSGFTMGDWAPQVTRFLNSKMGIANLVIGARVNHSFRELESSGILVLTGHQLKLTAIGLEIQKILS